MLPRCGRVSIPTLPSSALADRVLTLGGRHFDLSRPLLMGVVNLTPDSFSDGGRFEAPERAIAHARELMAAGADIIDLGAESTRPGAQPVTPEQELARLDPVVQGLRDLNVAISIDTRHAATMQAMIATGAIHLINDVTALHDDEALAAVARSDVGVCLMHMQGDPLTMQQRPVYASVLAEVSGFLQQAVSRARSAGVGASRLLVDPGIGFGKTVAHNLELLGGIATIAQDCQCPVLIGLSRKSMLGALTGRTVDGRLAASLGGALAAAARGAAVLRVHDVAQTRDALAVYSAIMSGKAITFA